MPRVINDNWSPRVARGLRVWIAGLAIALAATQSGAAFADELGPEPQPRAHAHNDYEHPRPLLDALEQGFCNVEADVHLVDGELLVAHDANETNPDRTLRKLYLHPLQERVRSNGGRVYTDGPTFTLLVDFKSSGKETYAALENELRPFHEMLVRYENGKRHENAVEIIISGDRPTVVVADQSVRFASIDGRLRDLDQLPQRHVIPLISDNWNLHFRWRGDGDLPAEESAKLRGLVKAAHEQGRRVRFWAIPDQANAWRIMADHGVDLINTDNLAGLAEFLRARDDKASTGQ
jgi:glycerophosphoryl diester phosphodiesterase